MIGLSLAAWGITMALIQVFVTGRAIRRLGEARTVLIGMTVAVATFVAIAFATTGWMVFALIGVGALGGLVFPGINALLSRSVDSANQGALQGGMASIGSVAEVIGPLAMTQTLAFGTEHGTPGAAFLLAAALAGTAALIVATRLVRWQTVAPA